MNTIKKQRDDIQQRRDAIDVDQMHRTVETAQREMQNFETKNAHRMGLEETHQTLRLLRGAVDQAQSDLRSAESDVRSLHTDLAKLDAMLNAGQRIGDTEAAIAPARIAVTNAQAALNTATGVLTEVDSLLAAEQDAHAERSRQATDELLAAVRAGQSPKRNKVDTGTLNTLEHAHVSAQAAVTEAGAVLTDAQATLDAALHDRKVAQTGATAYALHLAAHAYAQAVVTHEDACWACRAHFDIPDHEQLVLDAKREAVAELEDAESEAA